MKQTSLLVAACAAGLLVLAACNNPGATPATGTAGSPQANGSMRGNPQNLQKYAAEANAAKDKTSITKDQFVTELQAMMQAQRAKYQQNAGNGSSQNAGVVTQFQNGIQSRLSGAATFYKYTDPSGNEALIALDASGNVVMKWPRPFGSGRRFGTQASAQRQ